MIDEKARLQAVYDGLEQALAGATCPRSGRCCRFKTTGLTPYVWPVEMRRVLLAISRRSGRLPRGGAEGDCPLLLKDGSCSIYADRPFGCRTFFCGDATLPNGNPRKEIDGLAKDLRAISDALGERDLVPLTTHLSRHFGAEGRRRRG